MEPDQDLEQSVQSDKAGTDVDDSGLPADSPMHGAHRIVLVNPTSFLGNLLIAGDLIEQFIAFCRQQNRTILLVLDERFRELNAACFQGAEILWYPRQAIKAASAMTQARLFLLCLRQIRAFRADLAFNLEEDTVSSRLVQLSGARYRLGCSPLRHRFLYHRVLPIAYDTAAEGRHRWDLYAQVFSALGLNKPSPRRYLNLRPGSQTNNSTELPAALSAGKPLIAIHTSATKHYKRWPVTRYLALCQRLIARGYFPVLIGAGRTDEHNTLFIGHELDMHGLQGSYASVCNRLSLAQLRDFFDRHVDAFIGNDSGPCHMAAALDIPGLVLFGPSNPSLWGPLSPDMKVLQRPDVCHSDCSRRHCRLDYACLDAITPEDIIEELTQRLPASA